MTWNRRIASWLRDALLFVEEPAALWAVLAWPKFSITSYRMLVGLRRQGIVPASIVDVGANTGQFASAARFLYPGAKIIAFEPDPTAFVELTRHLGPGTGVELRPKALGATPGVLEFRLNADSRSSSALPIGKAHLAAFPHSREIGTASVPVSTLDQELESVQLATPCLLKVDVQGYEYRVLEGAREALKRIEFVILETSFAPLYEGEKPFAEMLQAMSDLGFEFLRPVGLLLHPETGEILQADALFRIRR